jgi:6-pyruvoyltetrahydropterin/6-carboxytetrahydropterin synthase
LRQRRTNTPRTYRKQKKKSGFFVARVVADCFFQKKSRFFFEYAMQVTRRLEFDAGHRIPDHKSQCRHLHGHRYALEITLSGEIIGKAGDPANGMVMDFSEIKALAKSRLVDGWDHAFLVYEGDAPVVEFLATLPEHKTVLLDCVPTAENLAEKAFRILDATYRDAYGNHLRLERVRLYETPNCWADAVRSENG